MALFKIFKGSDSAKLTNTAASGYRTPTDGYAYYDTSTKLFYIDAEYPGTSGVTRQPINASKAGVAGNALNGIFYGTCSTAQETQAKVATLNDSLGFTLQVGTLVIIKFTNASAAATMTLNVAGTGAKTLKLYGTTDMSSDAATTGWCAGAAVPFVYDGTNWIRFFWDNSAYWANLTTTFAAAYNAAPEMATLKLNGNTSATAASTSNVTLVFDATTQALNFVFA